METTKADEKVDMMNRLAQALSKTEGITDLQAMTKIKEYFTGADEATAALKKFNMPQIQPQHTDDESMGALAISEKARIEMRKLELQERQFQADQKKQDLAEKKLDLEMAFQREKLDREEKIQQRKLDAEEQWRQRQAVVAESQASLERIILLQNMSGKKPDELLEMMKSQSGMALEMVKSQAAGTEKMYQTLLDQKNSERDREMEIKTALAKIEADRDVKLGELRQEADAETASQMDILIQKMDEKFGPKIEKMPSSAESFINQMQEYKKMQDQFLTLTFDTLEARGFDKDQISIMKKAAKIEEAKQDTTVDKVWEVGKKIWKDYVEPNIDKAQRELSPPPQGGQSPTPEQAEQQREYQRRIASEQERIKAEVIRKQEENERLQAQLDQERQIHAQRQQLEDRAAQLGIAVNPSMADRQISDLIVRQEFIIEQGTAQREKLDAHAISIGITPDPLLTNVQLFDIIEHRESEIEQHRKSEIERESLLRLRHIERMKKEQETRGTQEEKPSAVQPVITPAEEVQQKQNDFEEKRLGLGLSEPQADIEELTKPPEISKETEEFLSSQGQIVEHRDTVVQVDENINEVAPQEASEVHFDELTKPQDKDAPKKKGRKKQDRQDKQEKQPNTYQVVREDGEPVGDVEAKNAHGAAMKAARITGATEDAPVTIKISGGGLEQDQLFKVSMAEAQSRGKAIQVAKAERL
jgi:hypothetical protein